ncbi:MAG TPA: MmoB/DmpM family protein [Actinomycetospora sp.]|jgi:toluene monooxygenase system protein D|uniref:MmoB/DmpM family protein n=1 Tax=Actinomycetospora sp. TaxID=1872135 RepID=UPI002F4003FA
MNASAGINQGVGPVLHATPFARTVVSVIEAENEGVLVHDEGAYLRVLASRVCRLSQTGLVAATGAAIRFPGDLEVVMSSFTGVLELTEDLAVWRFAGEPAAGSTPSLTGER